MISFPFHGRVIGVPFRMVGGGVGAGLGLKSSLIAWWELDEASGQRNDSHTNALHLTDNNTVTQAAGVGGGSAAQFTALNNESLSRADNALLEIVDNEFTVCAWAYADTLGAERSIVGKAGPLAEWGVRYLSTVSRFEFYVNGAVTFVRANTFGAPGTATWYFLVAQHDPTNDLLKISVNNGALDTVALVGGNAGTTDPFYLGTRDLANFWNGRMDKVALWRSAVGGGGLLSASQLTFLYNGGSGRQYSEL